VNVAAAPVIANPSLDGTALGQGLRAGCYRVLARAAHLDQINVFPVPDGDTGTNLAMTCRAVLAVLDRGEEPHAGALLIAVADAAVDGARGNSGAILAQYFSGMADAVGHRPALSDGDLASAFSVAAAHARNAISEPREGTIISLMEELAEFTSDWPTGVSVTPARLLSEALPQLRDELALTPHALAELRDAGVVDAGAEGFCTFIEGLAHFLTTGELGERVAFTASDEEALPAGGAAGEFRYWAASATAWCSPGRRANSACTSTATSRRKSSSPCARTAS
jgi:dihydroxyacetone kinase-like predicted kinase